MFSTKIIEILTKKEKARRGLASSELSMKLFFLVVKEAMAVALVIRILNLIAELAAHAFCVLASFKLAGAIAARSFKAFLY